MALYKCYNIWGKSFIFRFIFSQVPDSEMSFWGEQRGADLRAADGKSLAWCLSSAPGVSLSRFCLQGEPELGYPSEARVHGGFVALVPTGFPSLSPTACPSSVPLGWASLAPWRDQAGMCPSIFWDVSQTHLSVFPFQGQPQTT